MYKLFIGKDKTELLPADNLKELGNYATMDELVKEYGDKAGYISIGQAGEWKLAGASVAFSDRELRPTRHAGRGGLGAVMGSKGLKAIIIDPAGGENAPIKDVKKFKQASKRFAKALIDHPVSGQGLPNYGTNILVNIINEAGGLPVKNFKTGRFDEAENVSGEMLNKMTVERKGDVSVGCMTGCVIRCSGTYKNKKGEFVSKWPEYETVWAWGPNCGIDDLEAIVRFDYGCDDIGLDTIETGNAVAIAMDGGVKSFGDTAGAEELLDEIRKGTPIGRILGSGAEITGRIFGVRKVPVVKGQAMPAYDPRAVKGVGVTYATSPMGADHTAGYAVCQNILKVGGHVDPLKAEGQIETSKMLQTVTAAVDAAGLCLFVAFAALDNPDAFEAVVDMVNAKFGLSLTGDDIFELGRKILKMEKDFNTGAGFTSVHDRLPEHFLDETLPPHHTVFDVSNEELDSVMQF